MAESTFEEASRCPKCQFPGEDVSSQPAPKESGVKATIHVIKCHTPGCPWEDTTWLVQVNADGSIPAAHAGLKQDKMYPKRKMTEAQAAVAALARQYEAEQQPNAEIRTRPTGF